MNSGHRGPEGTLGSPPKREAEPETIAQAKPAWPAGRIGNSVAQRDAIDENGADPLSCPVRCFNGAPIDNSLQDGHHLRRRNGIDAMAADHLENIGLQIVQHVRRMT